MKFSISKPAAVKSTTKPTKDEVKKLLKEDKGKRRSEKEIALVILLDKFDRIEEYLKDGEFSEICQLNADGRKLKEAHVEKIARFIKGRLDRFRAPAVKLLKARGIV